MVVDAGVTEKFAALADVPIGTPAVGTVNQLMLLPAEVAFKLALAPAQIVAGDAVTSVGAVHGCPNNSPKPSKNDAHTKEPTIVAFLFMLSLIIDAKNKTDTKPTLYN